MGQTSLNGKKKKKGLEWDFKAEISHFSTGVYGRVEEEERVQASFFDPRSSVSQNSSSQE